MILCCGEALIDMIPEATQSGRDGFVSHCGGAVFNTAIALGRLGTRTGMLTGLSSDMFGRQLAEALGASRVDTRHVVTSDRPTTLAFVKLVDGHASYTFYDENSAGRMLMPDDMPPKLTDVSALYFGGISLACEPGADAYLAFAKRHASSRAVMLDPNIRAGFITDEERYRSRSDALISLADVVKVSDEDLNWINQTPMPLEEKARALLEHGPAFVIVTRGGEGASGFLKDGAQIDVPAQRVQIVDTVGAGDTFNAGVMAKLSERGQLTKEALSTLTPDIAFEALAFGANVAAITVSRAGANPPWGDEL
ncbi:fructokinase [Aliiroseovarius halocynthiae]|uniref:Carbohydrate kinase n=1 Tax=Aliiroseovarius halocynthiae TaxID=985055 RepID=A0A545SN91_9RHOB|nr:carbohydrate kinase [Aliiroseovarius halocynthiae]TQV66448.1 carbohydrate kinase [Aliiroseovarius halocynthiae]SMR83598.1 fructokinase [Aliiroseovarius halocynthiae]